MTRETLLQNAVNEFMSGRFGDLNLVEVAEIKTEEVALYSLTMTEDEKDEFYFDLLSALESVYE